MKNSNKPIDFICFFVYQNSPFRCNISKNFMISPEQLHLQGNGKRERVSLSEFAAKQGVHRSTASRRLKAKGIPAMEKLYKMESLIPVGLALLGFNRNQIKMITGIKAERLKARFLKLFYSRAGDQLFLDDEKIGFLAKRMNKLFGMGHHIRDVDMMINPKDTNSIFTAIKSHASATLNVKTFVKKVQRVLGHNKVAVENRILVIKGGKNCSRDAFGKTVSGFSFVVTRYL